MKKIKKMFWMLGFVLLMTLAVVGVGITGVAPTFTNRRTKNSENEIVMQLVEKKTDPEVSNQLMGDILE